MASHRIVIWSEVGKGFFIIASTAFIGFLGAAERSEKSSVTSATAIKPNYPSTSVFDRAVSRTTTSRSRLGQPVIGVLVNHHLIAANFMADTLRAASRPGIKRILLLAPNHFYAGYGSLITARTTFSTPYGVVATDREFIDALKPQSTLIEDPNPFQQEHGVYNVLPFIKKYFPGVPVVPIITRDSASPEVIDRFREILSSLLTPGTLVIASLDFAHNQTSIGADKLDQQSITLLQSMDPSAVEANVDGIISVDSPMTLRLFLGLMQAQGGRTFTVLHHSNSARESGQLNATNVTSHITGLVRRSF